GAADAAGELGHAGPRGKGRWQPGILAWRRPPTGVAATASRRQDAVPLRDAVRLRGQRRAGAPLAGPLAAAAALLDLVRRFQAFAGLAEHGVLAGQPGGGHGGDEELAAVGVRAGVGHGQHAALVGDAVVGLVLEAVAGAAAAGA